MTRLGTTACVAVALSSVGAGAETPPVPTPIGAGPHFHPGPSNAAVARGFAVGSLVCTRTNGPRWGVHLELFAHGRVVIVPAGIGIAPPLRRRGAHVLSGRCSYPARTREPTGVIELARSARITLGELFAVWGRPLTTSRLVGFTAPAGERIRAYVNGRLRLGDPRSIPLGRHDEIVLELGGYVPPHASYRFPKGL
jgi:hypothetical protein